MTGLSSQTVDTFSQIGLFGFSTSVYTIRGQCGREGEGGENNAMVKRRSAENWIGGGQKGG